MNYYFVIFSDNDTPVYELESLKSDCFKGEDSGRDLHKFIIHAALDMVDELRWSRSTGTSPYLKVVDRYDEWLVSAYLCPTGDKLMLLHDVKSEDAVRQFLSDSCDLQCKYALNVFYEKGSKISSAPFDKRIRQIATKYIN